MLSIVKIVSSLIDTFRITKYLRLGKGDVQTSVEASPYGIDSAPIADIRGVIAETQQKGDTVIIGYIFKEKSAEPGETYVFSTDTDGVIKATVKLKKSGDVEVNGDADFMVRFSELETAYNQLKDDHDALVSSYNGHIHTTTATVGATATPGVIAPTTSTEIPSTGDISGAKIDNVKTN